MSRNIAPPFLLFFFINDKFIRVFSGQAAIPRRGARPGRHLRRRRPPEDPVTAVLTNLRPLDSGLAAPGSGGVAVINSSALRAPATRPSRPSPGGGRRGAGGFRPRQHPATRPVMRSTRAGRPDSTRNRNKPSDTYEANLPGIIKVFFFTFFFLFRNTACRTASAKPSIISGVVRTVHVTAANRFYACKQWLILKVI